MNYQKKVFLFNISFLVSLILGTLFFQLFPSSESGWIKPLNILSEVTSEKKVIHNYKDIAKADTTKKLFFVKDYLTVSGLINSSGVENALSKFLEKLCVLKKTNHKKIRIGYFGDSMIEGDLITQDLRKALQDKFGGDGVGFVPITSIVSGFRQTINHSYSKNWEDQNLKVKSKSDVPLFFSGHSFFPTDDSWVKYKVVNQPHLDSFRKIEILYGMPKTESVADIKLNNISMKLIASDDFNIKEVNIESCSEIKIECNSTNIPFFGVSFESESGVFVDNFSFRGISGIELDQLSQDWLSKIQSRREYDLLIFHYGPNLLFKGELVDFKWYQKKMANFIRKVKYAFPEASILIISTADKAYKYSGQWNTQKGVQPLVDIQYSLANECKVDFFNLYQAMGGENSMVSWVNSNPPLANRDFTHVNFRGAKKIAEIIYSAIINELNDYQKHHD